MRAGLLIIVAAQTLIAFATRAVPTSSAILDSPPSAVARLYNSGSYDTAARQLQSAVDQTPKDASLQYWLGRCLFEMHDYDRAISSLKRAVNLDPNRSEYHGWLGRAYGRKAETSSFLSALSQAKKSKKELEAAIQLDPGNVKARRDLIEFLAEAPGVLGGGEARGLEQIQALSALDPLQGELALADFYAEREKYAQADAKYESILQSSPREIEAYLEAADYYRGRGNVSAMEQAVAAAENVAASDRRLNYYRGVALVLGKKDFESAKKALAAYIDTVPQNSELPPHALAYAYLGRLHEDQGRLELATEQYRQALAVDPENKMARQGLKRLQER